MQQRDAHFGAQHARVIAQCAAHEIGKRTGDLDARETTADHDKTAERAALVGVLAEFDSRQALQAM